jgi:hypothetical protein
LLVNNTQNFRSFIAYLLTNRYSIMLHLWRKIERIAYIPIMLFNAKVVEYVLRER